MVETNDLYKTKIKEQFRDTTKIEVFLHLIDDIDTSGLSIDYSNKDFFSGDMAEYAKFSQDGYATLEKDWFKVDGSRYVASENNNGIDRYTSVLEQAVSVVEFSFDTPQTLSGLVFYFVNSYPLTIYIDITYSTEETETFTCYPNDIIYRYENTMKDCISLYIRVVNEEDKRTRLNYIEFGTLDIFNEQNLISSRLDLDIDLISTELPQDNLCLSVYDFEGRYHPDIPGSRWDMLTERQKAEVYYGFEDNMFQRNILYLNKNIHYENHKLEINFSNALYFQSQIFNRGYYPSSPVLLTDILREVQDDFNMFLVTLIETPLGYIEETTLNPLPKCSVKEAVQLIANARQACLYENQDGFLILNSMYIGTSTVDYLTQKDELQLPLCEIHNQLKNVIVNYYNYIAEDEILLFEVTEEFTDDTEKTYKIEYDNKKDVRYELTVLSGTAIVNDSFLGAHLSEITVNTTTANDTVSYKLSVYGKNTSEIKQQFVLPVNTDGEDCIISNPLISNEGHASRVAQWIARFYSENKSYEFPFVQDYSLQLTDGVDFDTDLNERAHGIITKIQFNTPGLSGAIKIRKRGD